MSSRLCDAFKSHPVHFHDNQLDLESVQEVPESHAWPTITDCPTKDSYQTEPVPIIDLMAANAAKLVGNACENWGVFQITNHGIPLHLMEEVVSQGKRLFSLPSHQKLKAARRPDGISGYGRARISSFFSQLMWSEGFTVVGSPVEDARKLWPQDYEKFCDVIEEYEKELKNLATRITWVMLGTLGISKEDLKWSGPKGEIEGACAALQMNSYPPCPDPSKAMGLAEHTDSTLLTLLYQNNISGLQILKDEVSWITVPPVTGAFVVNVGDMLHIISNGRYKSILHRAVVHRTCHRLSFAYLYGPPPTSQISPLPKLVDLKTPPLYRTVTWSEYLGAKAKHFNKALSSIRITTPQQKSSI